MIAKADQNSAKETVFRREAALKLMLSTPHKPHATKKKKVTKKAKKDLKA